jgi:hypothetical protein
VHRFHVTTKHEQQNATRTSSRLLLPFLCTRLAIRLINPSPNPTSFIAQGMFDPVGAAKWTAWNELGDMSKDDAKAAYVKIVNDWSPATSSSQSGAGNDSELGKVCAESPCGPKLGTLMLNPKPYTLNPKP